MEVAMFSKKMYCICKQQEVNEEDCMNCYSTGEFLEYTKHRMYWNTCQKRYLRPTTEENLSGEVYI